MDLNGLGRRIREERLKLRLTQEKLAEDVDLSDAHIGQIERGGRCPTVGGLVRIANRLGVSVDYLLADSVKVNDATLICELEQLFEGRSIKEKKMAVDLIRTLFRNLDE